MPHDYVLHPFRSPVELHIDYAGELNEQQLAAVTAPPGPSLVIAGAGSGKTRTLIYRVAYLLEQGIPPERILLLTFTNKAAREMMRRVADLLGQDDEEGHHHDRPAHADLVGAAVEALEQPAHHPRLAGPGGDQTDHGDEADKGGG